MRSTRNSCLPPKGQCDTGRVSNPLFDLAPEGVYPAAALTRLPGGLLHHLFTLAPLARDGFAFCSTFRWCRYRSTPPALTTGPLALWSPDFPPRPRPGRSVTFPRYRKFVLTCTGYARTSGRRPCPGSAAPSVRWMVAAGGYTPCTRRRPAAARRRASVSCSGARNTATPAAAPA